VIARTLQDNNHYSQKVRHVGIAEDSMIEYGCWAETSAMGMGKARGKVDMKLLGA
jgi:hypothetical protein